MGHANYCQNPKIILYNHTLIVYYAKITKTIKGSNQSTI